MVLCCLWLTRGRCRQGLGFGGATCSSHGMRQGCRPGFGGATNSGNCGCRSGLSRASFLQPQRQARQAPESMLERTFRRPGWRRVLLLRPCLHPQPPFSAVSFCVSLQFCFFLHPNALLDAVGGKRRCMLFFFIFLTKRIFLIYKKEKNKKCRFKKT